MKFILLLFFVIACQEPENYPLGDQILERVNIVTFEKDGERYFSFTGNSGKPIGLYVSNMYVAQEYPYQLMWFIEDQRIQKNEKIRYGTLDKLSCKKRCIYRKDKIACYNQICPAPKKLLKGRKYIVGVSGGATYQEVLPLVFIH